MTEREKEFSKAIDDIIKGIEESLRNPVKLNVVKKINRKY